MNDATAWRLNSTDEMLHQAAATLGSSRVVQVLWRLPVPVPVQALRDEWLRLDEGLLSRRAAPARVPGARRSWVRAANSHPLHVDPHPLTDSTAPEWIDAQVRQPLPADGTELWRLAAAPHHDGCLISLTVPHFRSDGLGILNALAAPTPAHRPGGLADSDAADALAQVSRAVARTARWSLGLARDPRRRALVRAALRPRPAPAAGPPARPRFFTTAIFEVDAAAWQERARAHGGTANTLFLEIAANLVRARVPRAAHDDVRVGIPMNLRHGADERANALVVVPLRLPGGPVRHDALHDTRRATKTLLQGSGAHSATLVPEPLWHLLPARHAAALKSPGAQQTDVVASNFGDASDAVLGFAGHRADAVALRTMNVPGLRPDKARLRASLCLFRAGPRMTVTVTGMPDHFGDSASLHRLVAEEFAAWGLAARPWWAGAAHEATKG
ncbi:hypothetical protein I2W78_27365 [Streptomyces spinoverrucosus]|uniref:hypothetical protein n=1 Tax=Streptomyces spinoverrucosus TaxID=284043 RepID=UPI0018C3AA85|nr:hypothetical protein [Streptomyces spinoverrucosus]MBG0855459.1 hypothetical protein [Streptomyces spinoverrucosus]